MFNVSAQQVTDRVKKYFRPEDVDEALAFLDQDGKDESDMSPAEFMRLAILRLANGNIKKLPGLIRTAKKDYRDILSPIHYQYGHDWIEKFLNE
jgi:hypothetical protein